MQMNSIDKTLHDLRPKLRIVAPHTFWFSLGFGIFNTVIGLALFNVKILVTLKVVGIISLKIWSIIFMVQGITMLHALATNNWNRAKALNLFGVFIKTAWWLELLAITLTGRSRFLLYIWTLLLFFQIIVCIYFTPKVTSDELRK